MALIDVNYNFKFVDIGCNGRIRDGGMFDGCSLARVVSRVARPETDLGPLRGAPKVPKVKVSAKVKATGTGYI